MIRNIELRVTNYVKADQVGLSNNVGGTYSIYDVGRIANYQSLDLLENETINITLQNQDINDFSKIKVNFSKTFNIPATPKNNRYLIDPGNISKLYSTTQGPIVGSYLLVDNVDIYTYPIPCQIWVDGDCILEGQLNIKSVNRNITPNMIECIFTTDIKSIIPILKNQSFSSEYFRKPVTSAEIGQINRVKIIPENFIWDSILFENYSYTSGDDANPYSISKVQLLPTTATPSYYPRYIKQDLPEHSDGANFLNHIVSSWTQSNAKYYWGIIDDGTRPYINSEVSELLRTNQDLDKNHKIPSQLLLSAPVKYEGSQQTGRTSRISSIQSFQPFRDIRPYYYVSDILQKIFRWFEYKLNGEYYSYTTLQNTFPQYTNYDKPGITYSNTPIRISLDTNIFGTSSNPNMSDYVFIHPENDIYSNGQIDMRLLAGKLASGSGLATQMTLTATASIIKNAINLTETGSNWDEYGITYVKMEYNGSGVNGSITLNNTIEVGNAKIELPVIQIATNLPTPPQYYTLGIGTFSNLPNEIKNNLPPGHTQSTYINLQNIANLDLDKWKYYYINANKLAFNKTADQVNNNQNINETYNLQFQSERIKPLYNFSTTSNPIIQSATFGYAAFIKQDVTLYDLRRYVYPQLENYSMGDFIQDILKTFNIKIEEPLTQSPDQRIQLKTFDKYITDTINKYGIKDMSNIITADKMKITKTQYGRVNLKNEDQDGDLIELFYLTDFDKTGYGDYYEEFLSYNNNDKKLEVKTKLSNAPSNYLITTYSERIWSPIGIFLATEATLYGITTKKSNNKPVQVHSILSYNDYNTQKSFTVLLNNQDSNFLIKDYGVKKTKFKPFLLYNDRDPRITTDISFTNIGLSWSLATTYSVCQIHTGRTTIMPYDTQSNCGLFPTLTNYDKNGNSLLFDLTNANATLDSTTSSSYKAYYESEISEINSSIIIDTEINMNMSEFNDFTFAQLWKLKIQGEYKLFRINKLSDYTLNDDSMTKVQLIEIPNPLKWMGLTSSFESSSFGPSI